MGRVSILATNMKRKDPIVCIGNAWILVRRGDLNSVFKASVIIVILFVVPRTNVTVSRNLA